MSCDDVFGSLFKIRLAQAATPGPKCQRAVDLARSDLELFCDHLHEIGNDLCTDAAGRHFDRRLSRSDPCKMPYEMDDVVLLYMWDAH